MSVYHNSDRAKKKDFVEAMDAVLGEIIKTSQWEVINEYDVSQNEISFGGSFDLVLKIHETPTENVKLRFIAQRYIDRDKPYIVHGIAMLRASSIKVILSAVFYYGFLIFSYDVTQAYLQSK